MIRLDKYLTMTTGLSRSDAKKVLSKGKVTVNGAVVKRGDIKISEEDKVVCDGTACIYKQNLYYMLNKPQGVVSATEDSLHKTVVEIFPEEIRKRLFPVGRLDIDTEGLLILTDDGGLAHCLTSPNHDVNKVYYAEVSGIVKPEHIDVFRNGIEFKDFTTKPAVLEIISVDVERNISKIKITVSEGKFHQVKRMVAFIGCDVTYLKREKIGGLALDAMLEPGEYRELTDEEADLLGR
ncbi:MAG: rRNA pseudouridine synthase [Lachnospiraceae bacterium]|nr:rRNA pseudouridine synthase [Lachnospiraceae bacterium]